MTAVLWGIGYAALSVLGTVFAVLLITGGKAV